MRYLNLSNVSSHSRFETIQVHFEIKKEYG
jgi:hypothetical protein